MADIELVIKIKQVNGGGQNKRTNKKGEYQGTIYCDIVISDKIQKKTFINNLPSKQSSP